MADPSPSRAPVVQADGISKRFGATVALSDARITVAPGDTYLGNFTLTESDIDVAHKNKYGRDYDRPDPDSPAYARP